MGSPATYRQGYRTAVRSSPMQKVVLFAVVVVLGAVIGVGLKQASSKDSADTPKALDAASATRSASWRARPRRWPRCTHRRTTC